MMTILAPGLQARALGISGWFASNILVNRDGYVLDHPDNFKTKVVSKLSVVEDILRSDINPELYGDLYHKVRFSYYPPHGDNKESWDIFVFFGWLGYPMLFLFFFLCWVFFLVVFFVLVFVFFCVFVFWVGLLGFLVWLSFFFFL